MSKRPILLWLNLLLVPAVAHAQQESQPPVGWYVVDLPATSVAAPAVQAARDEIGKLAIRLVTTPEIKSFLKDLDQRKGIPERAGKALAQGRELHLGMKLSRAIEKYREAERILLEGFSQYYDPAILAQPVLRLGVALFQSNQTNEARKAFMRAASLVPSLQMSEGYYSPSVREAFEKARTELGEPQAGIPSPTEMDRITTAAGLRGVLVISVERLGDRPMLRMALFDNRLKSYRKIETAVLTEPTAARVGEEVARRLREPVAAVAGVSFVPTPPTPDGGVGMPDGGVPGEEIETDPWYVRHWWIWPVAAAVVGTAIALPLTVFRHDVVDVNVY
jgi:predicted outer membrane protein